MYPLHPYHLHIRYFYNIQRSNSRMLIDICCEQKDFQGFCTMQLWYYVSQHNGEQAFVEWFCKLFAHNMTGEVAGHSGTIFFNRDAVKTLHTLLNMSKAYGLDIQSFFDLLQRVAEEQVSEVFGCSGTRARV
jgi:hypothetical protein